MFLLLCFDSCVFCCLYLLKFDLICTQVILYESVGTTLGLQATAEMLALRYFLQWLACTSACYNPLVYASMQAGYLPRGFVYTHTGRMYTYNAPILSYTRSKLKKNGKW